MTPINLKHHPLRYRGFAIWPAADTSGYYFEITDLQGKTLYTSPDSYDVKDAAIEAAKDWIDVTISKEPIASE